jgi:hypothetical protein
MVNFLIILNLYHVIANDDLVTNDATNKDQNDKGSNQF